MGITTEVAASITFTLGAMTMHGYVLLSGHGGDRHHHTERQTILHRWLERREIYAILKLLLISAVLLSALPDRGFGPWQAINPYQIVVLICALSFVGYFTQKLVGKRVSTARRRRRPQRRGRHYSLALAHGRRD